MHFSYCPQHRQAREPISTAVAHISLKVSRTDAGRLSRLLVLDALEPFSRSGGPARRLVIDVLAQALRRFQSTFASVPRFNDLEGIHNVDPPVRGGLEHASGSSGIPPGVLRAS